MKTSEALTRFLKNCEEKGLSLGTRSFYHAYLKHIEGEYPELPTDTNTIEQYLKKRNETPAHRGPCFRSIQALYSYLEQNEGIKSPVPPKGPMGRPRKKLLIEHPDTFPPGGDNTLEMQKVVKGGQDASSSTSISTADVVEKYIAFKIAEGVSDRTVEEYRGRLGPFAKAFPTIPLDPDQIAQFLASLKVEHITRWDYRKHIIALYHFLERRKLVPEITKTFPRVKVPRKVRRVLSPEEMTSLFSNVKNITERAILTLLIDSKIRASELCSLTRENLHPDHIVVTGKAGQRSVPITLQTFTMLTFLAKSGPLFTVEGRPIKREYLRHKVQEIMFRAGLNGKKLGPQILRSSSSVQHIMHGGDLMSLKEELGHTTTRMTDQYAQLAFPEVKQKHGEVNVIGHIAPAVQFKRAICPECGLEVHMLPEDARTLTCLRCKKVVEWHFLDAGPEETEGVKQ